MNNTRKTTEVERESMEYLNTLRELRIVNMFGARPYLMEEMDLDKKEAGEILTLWMGNFNNEGNYETVNC